MRRIAGLVNSALLAILVERADIDPTTAKVIGDNVRRRIQRGDLDPGLETRDQAEKLFASGSLDDEVAKALKQGNREFVVHDLARG